MVDLVVNFDAVDLDVDLVDVYLAVDLVDVHLDVDLVDVDLVVFWSVRPCDIRASVKTSVFAWRAKIVESNY